MDEAKLERSILGQDRCVAMLLCNVVWVPMILAGFDL